jgi:MSHA biogenesis protein MshK
MLAMTCLAIPDGAARDALPDPTEPPAGVASLVVDAVADPQTALDLKAIFFARDRRVAIINDQRVREGGTIGSARILEIAPNRVRLLRDGEEIALELVDPSIKRDVGSAVAAAPPAAPIGRGDAPDEAGEAGR